MSTVTSLPGVQVVGQILETNNYDLFKIKKGNRDVYLKHVDNLVKKIAQKDLKVPIEVDYNFNIIDGQHRFFAYKKLGLKFRFFINSTATSVKDIQEQNSTKRDWKINDYMDSNIKLGNPHYIEYQNFIKRYDLELREGLHVFGISPKTFKDGDFKIDDIQIYNDIADKANIIIKNYPDNLLINDKLKAAIFTLLKTTSLDPADMVSRMIKHRSKMYNCHRATEYIEMLLKVYNYNITKKNQIHYRE